MSSRLNYHEGLGKAIDDAMGELPEGFSIELEIERNIYWIRLKNHELDDFEPVTIDQISLNSDIAEAVKIAKRYAPKSE